jgi:hypothetical protein
MELSYRITRDVMTPAAARVQMMAAYIGDIIAPFALRMISVIPPAAPPMNGGIVIVVTQLFWRRLSFKRK